MDLFPVARVVLFNAYKIYKSFCIFQRGFEVLKSQYFELLCALTLSEGYSESEMELFAESQELFSQKDSS